MPTYDNSLLRHSYTRNLTSLLHNESTFNGIPYPNGIPYSIYAAAISYFCLDEMLNLIELDSPCSLEADMIAEYRPSQARRTRRATWARPVPAKNQG